MNPLWKQFRPVSQVIGTSIRDIDDNPVGVANELLIDIDEGRVAYLRIRLKAGDGPDNWYVTVPWSAVRGRGNGDRHWTLGVHKRTLARMARQEADGNGDPGL